MKQEEILKKIIKQSSHDFNFFAEHFLKIRGKEHSINQFTLNREQKYINSLLNQQKTSNNNVKAIILKGRQVGVTTLVAARNYYINLMKSGVKSMTLTHRKTATNNVFEMISRFYQHSPFFLSQKRVFKKM